MIYFKAHCGKNDYLNSSDGINDELFVIYFIILIVGVFMPNLNMMIVKINKNKLHHW